VKLGLRGKLAVVLVIIILVAFGLVYIATSSLATSILRTQEIRTLANETSVLSAILVGLADDPVELDRALLAAAHRARLEALQVLNSNLETVSPRQGTPAEIILGRASLTSLARQDEASGMLHSPAVGQVFAAITPLPGGGFLFAARSTDAYHARKQTVVTLLVIWGAVVMLATLLAGTFLLRNVVARPIERLVREAGAVAVGDKSLPALNLESDEFGVLRESLSGMARRIQDDRGKIEEQVKQLTEVNKKLREAQEHLIRTEKLASVGQLAAGMAHEIGNPIGVILGYVEMLEDPELADAIRIDAVAQIRTATERIQGTIRDLLDFSRPATDEEDTSDLVLEAREIVGFVKPQKRFRKVNIKLEIPQESLPHGPIPPSRFKQVLLNLLFNAADAMDGEGDILVTLTARETSIIVTIMDSGPGIPDDMLLRVFDPFFTTKEVGKGTGLGLFVCHTIVNRYGGTIEVQSSCDGTTFTLVFAQ
jgi:two-component system, NtrC family, sensor kinase